MVSSGPSSRSEVKSTAYDTEIIDPVAVYGSFTLRDADKAEISSRPMKSIGSSKRAEGRQPPNSAAPTVMTAMT